VARQWAFADSDATAHWLTSLPSGPPRDAAIDAFITTMDGYDPALATAWAMAIEDPKQRQNKIGSAWLRWLERDPAAARLWVNGAEISEELRRQMVQSAETRTRR
jgi:hypothetical protein